MTQANERKGERQMRSKGHQGRHFSLEEWTDFTRQTGTKGRHEAMENHLQTCQKCAEIAAVFSRVHEVARRQHSTEPPAAAVRMVKGMFGIHGPKRDSRAKSFVAALLFDSFSTPLQAGVRSSGTDTRHLLFGTQDYRVDLRIEPQQDSDKVSLVGQILDASDPDKKLDAAPVALLRGRKVLAESHTNSHGEFNLECDLEQRFELRVTLPGNSQVSIPLVDPIGPPSEGHSYLSGSTSLMDAPQGKKESTSKKV
jgi:hypothetical protein